jgi:hypothetical protein
MLRAPRTEPASVLLFRTPCLDTPAHMLRSHTGPAVGSSLFNGWSRFSRGLFYSHDAVSSSLPSHGLGRGVGRWGHPPTLADQHPRLPALEDGVCVGQCSPNVDVLSVALAKRCFRTVIFLFRPFVSLFVETPVLLSSYVRELAKGERRYANP